ncbi:uncharacterized protein LOC120172399 [Hibiscus syriacus]|uniref:uncharacterized protein LOC120172399 n=1 Tax=Hibiscus syriacus TaxID=106335 RepID=UPI0019222F73|nr:uncharacterized protein LOC120172399 [Hibiscus syriacus]
MEEMKVGNNNNNSNYNRIPSPGSSGASIPSSGTLTSICTDIGKFCRPMDHVIVETQVKGTLIQRLDQAEDRLLKLCVQLEEELEKEKRRQVEKKGIKQFVKQCVVGKHRRAQRRVGKIK